MFIWLLTLVPPATAPTTPVVVTETKYATESAPDAVVKTMTSTPREELYPFRTYEMTNVLSYPSWVESVLATAIPSTWEERYATDTAFQEAVIQSKSAGILPGWYTSLPSDVKNVISSDSAVHSSEVDAFLSSLRDNAPSVTTTSRASVISSTSTSAITGATVSGSSTATSKGAGTSTSTGGATGATGGRAVGIAGAAGILGLALAL